MSLEVLLVRFSGCFFVHCLAALIAATSTGTFPSSPAPVLAAANPSIPVPSSSAPPSWSFLAPPSPSPSSDLLLLLRLLLFLHFSDTGGDFTGVAVVFTRQLPEASSCKSTSWRKSMGGCSASASSSTIAVKSSRDIPPLLPWCNESRQPLEITTCLLSDSLRQSSSSRMQEPEMRHSQRFSCPPKTPKHISPHVMAMCTVSVSVWILLSFFAHSMARYTISGGTSCFSPTSRLRSFSSTGVRLFFTTGAPAAVTAAISSARRCGGSRPSPLGEVLPASAEAVLIGGVILTAVLLPVLVLVLRLAAVATGEDDDVPPSLFPLAGNAISPACSRRTSSPLLFRSFPSGFSASSNSSKLPLLFRGPYAAPLSLLFLLFGVCLSTRSVGTT
mmetsp:Transcript_24456/g.40741  ORF Transcript_24456/g.40741 Transcript_24456/m.40741 type:complete len:388 (-) Transcript_24456:641-1804(-)